MALGSQSTAPGGGHIAMAGVPTSEQPPTYTPSMLMRMCEQLKLGYLAVLSHRGRLTMLLPVGGAPTYILFDTTLLVQVHTV